VMVVAPDPAWRSGTPPHANESSLPLGDRVLAIVHVGSTAVPGLWAKPMIDIDLTVEDSADEDAWIPASSRWASC
jgi:GrpB-like predicted nucleotidyltransferase (UPF0157 family)